MSCVYLHRNKINGKVYVGKTDLRPKERWSRGRGYKQCPSFYLAIQKYGWNNFEHEILLDDLTPEAAVEWERVYIAFYNSTDRRYGYNVVDGGTITSGKLGGEATAKVLRRAVCQYDIFGNLIAEYPGVNAAAKAVLGKKRSSAICQVCNGIGGTSHGFVWRYKGDPFDKYDVASKSQKTMVDKYTLDGEFICRYYSLTDAEHDTGAMHGDILRCCKGQRTHAKGYAWRFVDEC